MDAEEQDREAKVRALAHFRDGMFADWLVIALGLAAETHPEELRKAFAKVFDLSALEDAAKRLMLVMSQAQQEANEAMIEFRILRDEVNKGMSRMEVRQDGITERLEARVKTIEASVARVVEFLRRHGGNGQAPIAPAANGSANGSHSH